MATALRAQERDELRLISSSHSRLNGITGHMVNYRPVYEHHGSTLSADSGYVYDDEEGKQYFDAFGKVIITQPNGTVVYADKLHYVAETQLATLTNNVRMVDGNAVLTTNFLTYNMKSHIGTYTGGGRIVNTTDTITSRNAWYFDNTKDAYFRHDVVVRTPDVRIFTDTMRYNSATKINYFYGPTNIKGNDGENLYTERGEYHTETEQAWFDRNNLYTEGSRFLRGDSLYYDGRSGNGRATQNVVFIDTADQFFAYGGIGLYQRGNESITMTEKPLVMTVTRNDSTVVDSTAVDSVSVRPGTEQPAVDTIYMTADTLFSQLILLKDYVPMVFDLDREGGEIIDYEEEDYGEDFGSPDSLQLIPDSAETLPDTSDILSRTAQTLPDSLHAGRDSLQAAMKAPPDSIMAADDAAITDSAAAAELARKPDSAVLKTHTERVKAVTTRPDLGQDALAKSLTADSLLRAQAIIPTGREADSLMARAVSSVSRAAVPDTSNILAADSSFSDTVKTRIVKAYYSVRLFKSDLQAVADSVYYGYPDSMMRFFGQPMIWAQGSQMTADTIFMQIRNEQLDNMLLVGKAFMVNTQLDSSKFNQIKGRKITGFFTDNELERMFIDGNAESIYYVADEKSKVYTEMYHSRSSRIKILLDSNRITHFIPIRRVDGKVYPIHLVPQETEILEGFVWKPGDRPTSKEDLLTRRRATAGADAIRPDTPEAPELRKNDPLPEKPDEPPRDTTKSNLQQDVAVLPEQHPLSIKKR